PTIRDMPIPETPAQSAQPTADKKTEPTIRDMPIPETPAQSAQPTADKKTESTSIPTFSRNAPPLPPSNKK
ncbi:MAG: hypothetical protein ACQJCO_06470, partial [cyanobacterium endosymbiont of Rhopalodia sterrenbergii]